MQKYKYLVAVILMVMLMSCGFKHPDMASGELDSQAKQFVPSPSKSKIYIIRPSKFGGAGVELFPTINRYASGTLASGSYMMLEIDPGEYTVSAAGNLQDPESIPINAKAGQLYFVQMYPKVKIGVIVALSPGLQIETLNLADAKDLVRGLDRFKTVAHESYVTEAAGPGAGTLYFIRPKTFYGAASNNKINPTVDARVAGSIEMGHCLKSSVRIGAHTISAIGKFEGNSSLDLNIEKDKEYFITLTPKMGMVYPKLKLELIDPKKNSQLTTNCR